MLKEKKYLVLENGIKCIGCINKIETYFKNKYENIKILTNLEKKEVTIFSNLSSQEIENTFHEINKIVKDISNENDNYDKNDELNDIFNKNDELNDIFYKNEELKDLIFENEELKGN
jgi:hypothetical protein